MGDEVNPRARVYRRRRRYQGASWTPPSFSSEVEDGEWCKPCRKRHGYMSMLTLYERRERRLPPEQGKLEWYLLWCCPRYQHVVAELCLRPTPVENSSPIDMEDVDPLNEVYVYSGEDIDDSVEEET